MELKPEQLTVIEDMAAHFMTVEEIAIMIEVDFVEFARLIADHSSAASKIYYKGKVASKLEYRRKVVKMAKAGSPQAETLVNEFIDDQQLKEDL